MQKILIFIDWYYPAYKAGGPIQSCKNLIAALHNEIEFYVFTSNTDFNSNEFLDVVTNEWTKGLYSEKVFYCDKNAYSLKLIKQIIKDINPSCIYINSMFSIKFALVPLAVSKFTDNKVVLATRGMLHSGAMRFKKSKKIIYLKSLNLFGISKNLIFQATDLQEKKDIIKYFPNNNVYVKQNFAKEPSNYFEVLKKEKGKVSFIFLSRIVPKKNLLFFLNILLKVNKNKNYTLDIYGDIGDSIYWKECLLLINKINEENECVFYKGIAHNDNINEILKRYQVYILPTQGENFGHSIYEALSVGKPVLISDKTPWRNLKEIYAGWDIPLHDELAYIRTVEELINMDNKNYYSICNGSRILAEQYYLNSLINLKSKYVQLFYNIKNESAILPKVLIFIDWYYPAYKAGGSIQSCKNLIAALHNKIDFYIFTSNTDFSVSDSLPVKTNIWTNGLYNEKVFYCSNNNYSYNLLKKTIKDINPVCIYSNSMFSIQYSIKPIWAAKQLKVKTVLATHGMLQEGAMQFKSSKKNIFIKAIKANGLLKNVHFQATDQQEKFDILKYFPNNNVSLINNIANTPISDTITLTKKIGKIDLVFISRIVPKKNLLFFLEILNKIENKNSFTFTVYGDIGDVEYWNKCKRVIDVINNNNEVVFYDGVIENSKVANTLQNFHFFVLSTEGENFGYAIYESLSVGRPVILSDKTPWQDLEEKKAGFEISLLDEKQWLETIFKTIEMNQIEFNDYCNGALKTAKNYYNNTTITNDYLNLFTN